MANPKNVYLDPDGNATTYLDENGNDLLTPDAFVGPELPSTPRPASLPSGLFTDPESPPKPVSPRQGDIGRVDEAILGIDNEKISTWMANKASNLPRSLQWPAAAIGTAAATIPLDIIASIFGAPESPALMATGAMKNAILPKPRQIKGLLESPKPKTGILVTPDGVAIPNNIPNAEVIAANTVVRDVPARVPLPKLQPIINQPDQMPQVMNRMGVSEPENLTYPLNIVPRRLQPAQEFFSRNVPESIQSRTAERGLELKPIKPIEAKTVILSDEGITPRIGEEYIKPEQPSAYKSSISGEPLKTEFDELQLKLDKALGKVQVFKNTSKSKVINLRNPTPEDVDVLIKNGYEQVAQNSKSSTFKKLSNEEGVLKLRGFGKDQSSQLRKSIIDEIASRDQINLADTFERFKTKISRSQFDKVVNDIIESGDIGKIRRSKPIVNDLEPMQMAPTELNETQQGISALINSIKDNIIARNEQDLTVRAEKSRRIGNARKANVPGMQGLFNQLRELKGEYPKITPTQMSESFSPELIDSIRDSIERHPNQDFFAKLDAQLAFGKLVGAVKSKGALQRSEIEALQNVIGPEQFNELVELHGGLGLAGNPTLEKILKLGEFSKTVRPSGDIGWPLRQALPYAGRSEWFKSLGPSIRSAVDRNYAKGQLKSIYEDPQFQLAKDAGLDITDYGAKAPELREESNPSQWFENIEKAGGLKKVLVTPVTGSNRAMTIGLSRLRFGVYKQMRARYQDLYESMIKEANGNKTLLDEAEEINPSNEFRNKKIAEEINTATGRGSLGKLEKVSREANALLFSPRLLSSRIHTINRVLNPVSYMRYNKIQRIDALKQLLSIGGVIAISDGLMSLRNGTVSNNPTSTDFLKSKIGETRVDSSGGFLPLITSAVKLAKGVTTATSGKLNHLGDFGVSSGKEILGNSLVGNRLSPIASFIGDLIDRHEFAGKPLNFSSLNPWENTASRELLVPMITQDLYDLWKSNSDLLPWLKEAAILGPMDAMGSSVNTYEKISPEDRKEPKLHLEKFGPLSLPVEDGVKMNTLKSLLQP